MRTRTLHVVAQLLGIVTLVAGCTGPVAYMNPGADLSFYRRVGVAQFLTLADDPKAGQKVQRVFVTELLKRKDHEVVAPGYFTKIETDVRNQLNIAGDVLLDSAALQLIGQKAGVQGIILGTVRDYRMERVGQEEYPMISLSLQMIDAPTGQVVWDISLGERGGPKFPVLAIGETHTLDELLTKLCRNSLRTLK
ncbi:MAG: hypothetical protein HZB43_05460 [candidate division Zixibacteria bacterium]|nr:hypothetical protein [candidate division Zixibacteria bacterium]